MPKYVIRSTVNAVHSRVIYIESFDADQAALDFIDNTINNMYNGMPTEVEFMPETSTFEIDLADTPHPDQLHLGLYH